MKFILFEFFYLVLFVSTLFVSYSDSPAGLRKSSFFLLSTDDKTTQRRCELPMIAEVLLNSYKGLFMANTELLSILLHYLRRKNRVSNFIIPKLLQPCYTITHWYQNNCNSPWIILQPWFTKYFIGMTRFLIF